jgi:hypothetical protein
MADDTRRPPFLPRILSTSPVSTRSPASKPQLAARSIGSIPAFDRGFPEIEAANQWPEPACDAARNDAKVKRTTNERDRTRAIGALSIKLEGEVTVNSDPRRLSNGRASLPVASR